MQAVHHSRVCGPRQHGLRRVTGKSLHFLALPRCSREWEWIRLLFLLTLWIGNRHKVSLSRHDGRVAMRGKPQTGPEEEFHSPDA